jgi:thioredoxin-like negative regulator of GroEL
MSSEILLRLLGACALIVTGWILYKIANRLVLVSASTAKTTLGGSGHPSIVYFTSPDCVPCKTIQRPAILKLKQILGEQVELVEINTYEQPELSRQWGVLSVPTTFVLNRQGKPLHVNHGVAQTEKLMRQIRSVL